jgi:hypothetical protein
LAADSGGDRGGSVNGGVEAKGWQTSGRVSFTRT